MAILHDKSEFPWLTLAEAADAIGIDYQVLAHKMRGGQFAVKQVGKTYIVRRDIVDTLKKLEEERATKRDQTQRRRAEIKEQLPPGAKFAKTRELENILSKPVHSFFKDRMKRIEDGEFGAVPDPVDPATLPEEEQTDGT